MTRYGWYSHKLDTFLTKGGKVVSLYKDCIDEGEGFTELDGEELEVRPLPEGAEYIDLHHLISTGAA